MIFLEPALTDNKGILYKEGKAAKPLRNPVNPVNPALIFFLFLLICQIRVNLRLRKYP